VLLQRLIELIVRNLHFIPIDPALSGLYSTSLGLLLPADAICI